jgi:hypothetical protein
MRRQLLLFVCALFVTASYHSARAQCDPLDVLDDGTGSNGTISLPALVMSEISPGNYIELFNTTGTAITLAGAPYWLCSPFAYVSLATLAPSVTVPANGYATVTWPAGFTDTNAGGEVILYASASFNLSTEILDFVCWGTNPHGSRKTQAESVGKWSVGCALALTSGAIHRRASTTGTTLGDYDTVAGQDPENCDPVTGVGDTPALQSFALRAFPNPFNADTRVEFNLDAPGRLEVAVFSVTGQRVRVLSDRSYPVGTGSAAWDGRDAYGRRVASGTYLIRVTGSGFAQSTPVTLLR